MKFRVGDYARRDDRIVKVVRVFGQGLQCAIVARETPYHGLQWYGAALGTHTYSLPVDLEELTEQEKEFVAMHERMDFLGA